MPGGVEGLAQDLRAEHLAQHAGVRLSTGDLLQERAGLESRYRLQVGDEAAVESAGPVGEVVGGDGDDFVSERCRVDGLRRRADQLAVESQALDRDGAGEPHQAPGRGDRFPLMALDGFRVGEQHLQHAALLHRPGGRAPAARR